MSSVAGLQSTKKRKPISSSKGSHYTLWQCKRRDSKLGTNLVPSSTSLSQAEALLSINSSCSCFPPCVQRVFTNSIGEIDFNKAVAFVQEAQKSYSELDDEDKDTFLISKFKESITNIDEVNDSLSKKLPLGRLFKFDHSWKVYLGNDAVVIVCRKAIASIYGCTPYKLDRVAQVLKEDYNAITLEYKQVREDTIWNLTINETEHIFESHVEDTDPSMAVSALTPLALTQHEAVIWMENYFHTYGDSIPNRYDEIHISLPDKQTLWLEYKQHQEENEMAHVNLQIFYDLWNTLFPRYTIREIVDIPGKCLTCYEIDSINKNNRSNKNIQVAVKHLSVLHRGGYFQRERDEYYRNRLYAQLNQDTCLSIIMDGMDQSHSRIPYLGSAISLSESLTMHIEGVNDHGSKEVTLFCTLDHIQRSCDLTLYCILSKLADWRHKHNAQFPEIIFIQCDGGSENANRYLLALLEFIVVKRMAKKVVLTRLPVGHTHEDMDAIFGLLWKWMKGRVVETIKSFTDGVEEAFSHHKSKLKVKVKFVDIVPDYQDFFKNSVDPLLERYTKEDLTQHRWSFEAVEKSSEFPFGVKTMYKTYASDKVVEIKKIPKENCMTDLGQLTGLEPRTTYSTWYPTSNCIENRIGIEGFYILTKVPHSHSLVPCLFDEKGVQQYSTLHKKIQRLWLNGDEKREWWDKYMETSPRGTVQTYMTLYPTKFEVPLKRFFNKDVENRNIHHWGVVAASNRFHEQSWPTELAACMPSVVTTFNRHPGPSRIICTDNEILTRRLEYFNLKTIPYYEGLKHLTITKIMETIIKSRLTYNGELIHSQDTKGTLINAIKRDDLNLFKLYFRDISDESSYLVNYKLYDRFYLPNQANERVCSLKLDQNMKFLTLKDFRSLGLGCKVTTLAMNYNQDFNQMKQNIFHKNYNDLYRETRTYMELKKINFPTSISLKSFLDAEYITEWDVVKDFKLIVLPVFDEDHNWMVIFVDIQQKLVMLYNPVDDILVDESLNRKIQRSAIRSYNLPDENWGLENISSSMADLSLTNNRDDSGIMVIATILFICQHCPLFYKTEDVNIFRENYCCKLLRMYEH